MSCCNRFPNGNRQMHFHPQGSYSPTVPLTAQGNPNYFPPASLLVWGCANQPSNQLGSLSPALRFWPQK